MATPIDIDTLQFNLEFHLFFADIVRTWRKILLVPPSSLIGLPDLPNYRAQGAQA